MNQEAGREYNPELYDRAYWEGATVSNYHDYAQAEWVVREQAKIAHMTMRNRSGIGKLLEVASAYGHGLVEYTDLGWDAEGFELSEYAVEKGREQHHDINLIVGNVLDPDTWNKYEDKEFDLLVNFEMLEHIPWEACLSVVENMARVAKWGTFTLDCTYLPDQDTAPCFEADKTHLHCFPKTKWLNLFAQVGQPDYEAMHEFYQRTYMFNRDHGLQLGWGPRSFVVKFD